jgi:hypothetical protein
MFQVIRREDGQYLRIVCSWCKKFMGEKEPYDDSSETHGRCAECLKKQRDEK